MSEETVAALLKLGGQTYAEQAGMRLADKPAPLYRLLVLTVLLSIRIRADIAVAAFRELDQAGMGTPQRMLHASWQQRVDALGRAHYVRYDESTATALGEGAQQILQRWGRRDRRFRGGTAIPLDLAIHSCSWQPCGALVIDATEMADIPMPHRTSSAIHARWPSASQSLACLIQKADIL